MINGDNSFKIHGRCLIFLLNNRYCHLPGYFYTHLYPQIYYHIFFHFRSLKVILYNLFIRHLFNVNLVLIVIKNINFLSHYFITNFISFQTFIS